jgi:hypothetical protein
MKLLLPVLLVSAMASAQSLDAPHQEATVSVEARANAVIPGSTQRVTKSVPIPPACTYVRHNLDVLERQPGGREEGATAATSFSAEMRRDTHGRIDSVALTVVANVLPSLQPSAIGIRLSVVMRCDASNVNAVTQGQR